MTLPTGPISLLDLQNEFGGTTPISLGEYYRQTMPDYSFTTEAFVGYDLPDIGYGLIPADSTLVPIGLDKFRHQSQAVFDSDTTNVNLRSWAISKGWDGNSYITIIVPFDVFVYSNVAGGAALTISGSWPNGVTLINRGNIMGQGGGGVYGTDGSAAIYLGTGAAYGLTFGGSGVKIINYGAIAGGGGEGAGPDGGSGAGGGGYPPGQHYIYNYLSGYGYYTDAGAGGAPRYSGVSGYGGGGGGGQAGGGGGGYYSGVGGNGGSYTGGGGGGRVNLITVANPTGGGGGGNSNYTGNFIQWSGAGGRGGNAGGNAIHPSGSGGGGGFGANGGTDYYGNAGGLGGAGIYRGGYSVTITNNGKIYGAIV